LGFPSTALQAGSYTPAAGTGTNVTQLLPRLSRWARLGDAILVFGEFDIQPTLEVGMATRFRLSLPVVAGFDDVFSVAGDFYSSAAGATGTIFANPGVDGQMQLAMKAKHSDLRRYMFQAMYQVRTSRADVVPTNPSPPLDQAGLDALRAHRGL
jgi:hypothetical protein